MKRIFAIDPGPQMSAWIIFRPGEKMLFNGFGKEPNNIVENHIMEMSDDFDLVVIEKVAPYINPYARGGGMSGDIINTAIQIGRFTFCADLAKKEHVLIPRKTIVATVTGNAKGGDKEVRSALIKRFGEQGTMKNPGGTYGISCDVWQALAAATAYCDKNVIQEKPFQPAFLP